MLPSRQSPVAALQAGNEYDPCRDLHMVTSNIGHTRWPAGLTNLAFSGKYVLQVCTSLEQLVPVHELLRGPRAVAAIRALADPLPDQSQGHLHASLLPSQQDLVSSGLLSCLPSEFKTLPFGQLGKTSEVRGLP